MAWFFLFFKLQPHQSHPNSRAMPAAPETRQEWGGGGKHYHMPFWCSFPLNISHKEKTQYPDSFCCMYTSVHLLTCHGLWHSCGTIPLLLRVNHAYSMLKVNHKRHENYHSGLKIVPCLASWWSLWFGQQMSRATECKAANDSREKMFIKRESLELLLPIPSGSLSLGRRWLLCCLVPQSRGPCWHSEVGLQSHVSSEQYRSSGGG